MRSVSQTDAGHGQSFKSVDNLGHPCPADTQEPSQLSPRLNLTRIEKRLVIAGLFESILRWHRNLVAKKFDSSDKRKPGRPRIRQVKSWKFNNPES